MDVTATLTGRPACWARPVHAALSRRSWRVSDPRGRACRPAAVRRAIARSPGF